MRRRETLHQKLDLISSGAVLKPLDESGLVDTVKHQVCSLDLQQGLAVINSSSETVVLLEHMLPPRGVRYLPTVDFSAWLRVLLTQKDTQGLDYPTSCRGRCRRTSREEASTVA